MGGVLVNFKNPLKVKTKCRFEQIKAEVKFVHYKQRKEDSGKP